MEKLTFQRFAPGEQALKALAWLGDAGMHERTHRESAYEKLYESARKGLAGEAANRLTIDIAFLANGSMAGVFMCDTQETEQARAIPMHKLSNPFRLGSKPVEFLGSSFIPCARASCFVIEELRGRGIASRLAAKALDAFEKERPIAEGDARLYLGAERALKLVASSAPWRYCMPCRLESVNAASHIHFLSAAYRNSMIETRGESEAHGFGLLEWRKRNSRTERAKGRLPAVNGRG